ncbi:MAG: Gluconolactonase [Rhodoferax sp.]|nr:Gluconolactonase [Rhodoferax sp.]
MQEVASQLRFPEGPVMLGDGSLLVVEIEAGCLTRIRPGGGTEQLAELGGGPNGAALGPDGRCYVCNNGGFAWRERDGALLPSGTAANYSGGSIQSVDLTTGEVKVVYERCREQRLNGPNDIVFDAAGNFWFTDHGHAHGRSRDRGAVYYARPDGSSIEQVIYPLEMPNGIALSPDGGTLYVSETVTGRLWAWPVTAPGQLGKAQRNILGGSGRLVHGLGGFQLFDSMAVDIDGNLHVGTVPSGISVISPEGRLIEQIAMPEKFATNLCFGGPDMRTAYVTLSSTGRVVAMPSGYTGARVNFQPRSAPT